MPGAAEVSISEHLSKIPAAVRPTVKAARQLVRTVAPKAAEISYRSEPPRSSRAMWKIARYAVDGANVVGIGTFPGDATLWFYLGRELDDPNGLLAGGGKDSRFITLRSPADAARPAVRRVGPEGLRLGGALRRSGTSLGPLPTPAGPWSGTSWPPRMTTTVACGRPTTISGGREPSCSRSPAAGHSSRS